MEFAPLECDKAVAGLRHPNTVQLVELGVVDFAI